MTTIALLAAAAACAVLAIAVLLGRRGRGADLGLEVVPVAAPGGPRLRLRVGNRGALTARDVALWLRPAPPGVAPDRIPEGVRPAPAVTTTLARPLAPGCTAEVELACPVQSGHHYRRAFGLDPGADEPLYALPIETLLHAVVRWRERPIPGAARRRRRTFAGGRRVAG